MAVLFLAVTVWSAGGVLASLQPHHLLITSYDLLRKICQKSFAVTSTSVPHCLGTLQGYLFDVLVADEAHCLRNPRTELYGSMTSLQVWNRQMLFLWR